MKRKATFVLTALAILVAPCIAMQGPVPRSQKSEPQKKEPAKKAEAKPASMTGCIDQQDGKYVLTDDRGLAPIADLEAAGFPTEGFAKHVGHKVIVKGASTPSGTRPVFKVRAVETVSETCSPGNNSQEKK